MQHNKKAQQQIVKKQNIKQPTPAKNSITTVEKTVQKQNVKKHNNKMYRNKH